MRSSNDRSAVEHDLLLLGKVVGLHGLNGYLKVESYAESVDSFPPRGTIYVEPKGGLRRPHIVEGARLRRNTLLLKLEGVNTVDQAERFVGSALFIARDDLRPIGEGEYYWFELFGLNVVDEKGESLGVVKNLYRTTAYDMLSVRRGTEEHLIPAVPEFVRMVDLKNKRLVLSIKKEELRDPEP